jgi:hypothetical protein
MFTYQEIINKLIEVQDRIYGCGNGKAEIDKLIKELNDLLNTHSNSN